MGRKVWGLALAVLVAGGVEGFAAKAFGGLTLRTTLTPTDVAVGTSFDWSYFSGAVADLPRSTLSSIPSLAENVEKSTGYGYQVVLPSPGGASFVQLFGYHKQDIVLDWPVGVVGAVSELAFSWDAQRHYLWGYFWMHYAGVALKLKVAIARSDASVGSGLEVGFAGTTLWGLALSIASQFGLTTDRTALARAVSLGQVSGEMFDYRGTSLTAGVFPLCCLSLSATVRLTKTRFDSARITTTYAFSLAGLEVTAGATVVLTTADKALTIVPRLTLPESGSEIYLSFSLLPGALSPSSPALTGIAVHGIGLSRIQLGEVAVSGVYSLSGAVYRRGGQDDINLRASHYAFQPGAGLIGLPYDLIVSLEHSTLQTSVAGDFYFSAAGGGYLFGLALVTFEAGVTLFGDFRIGMGVSFATNTGWQRLVLELNYTFNLYGL